MLNFEYKTTNIKELCFLIVLSDIVTENNISFISFVIILDIIR